MPSNSTIPITPSISQLPSDDGGLTIQEQESGSTINHTGKGLYPSYADRLGSLYSRDQGFTDGSQSCFQHEVASNCDTNRPRGHAKVRPMPISLSLEIHPRLEYQSKLVGQGSDTIRPPSSAYNFEDESMNDDVLDKEIIDGLMDDEPIDEELVDYELMGFDINTGSFEPKRLSLDIKHSSVVSKFRTNTRMDVDEDAATNSLAPCCYYL